MCKETLLQEPVPGIFIHDALRCAFLFEIPFDLQFVPVHSANCVKTYTVACRRVLTSAPL
jgi:hypothetical protein